MFPRPPGGRADRLDGVNGASSAHQCCQLFLRPSPNHITSLKKRAARRPLFSYVQRGAKKNGEFHARFFWSLFVSNDITWSAGGPLWTSRPVIIPADTSLVTDNRPRRLSAPTRRRCHSLSILAQGLITGLLTSAAILWSIMSNSTRHTSGTSTCTWTDAYAQNTYTEHAIVCMCAFL